VHQVRQIASEFGSDLLCFACQLGAPDGTTAPRRCGLALSTDALPSPLAFEDRATNKTLSGLDLCLGLGLGLGFGLLVCIQHGLAVGAQALPMGKAKTAQVIGIVPDMGTTETECKYWARRSSQIACVACTVCSQPVGSEPLPKLNFRNSS